MRKPLLEGTITVIIFFAILFTVRQADWMSILKVEHMTKTAEAKLGNLFWDFFRKSDKENKDRSVNNAVDSLVRRICSANDIDRSSIKIHILNKDEINAFALPDGHLVIYSGLITASENQEELSGVISHELAHIQMDHVMKKLVKEVGITLLISATDYPGSGKIQEAAKLMTSTAFDRNFETEADLKAVDYLIKSRLNPVPFANFLRKMATKHDESSSLDWISTHPASKDRADYIAHYSLNKTVQYQQVLTKENWGNLKKAVTYQQ
jgi:beta-barrel assembly-enhancing protease